MDIHQALVDSGYRVSLGCTQTLVLQTLVRHGALLEAEWVEVRCVHEDIHKYPIVLLQIKYKGKTHGVKAAVSLHLRHPLILGTDLLVFNNLLGQCVGMQS